MISRPAQPDLQRCSMPLIPLILADTAEDVIKVLFGGLFVLIWIVGGIVSATKKRRHDQQRRVEQQELWERQQRAIQEQRLREAQAPPPQSPRAAVRQTPATQQ